MVISGFWDVTFPDVDFVNAILEGKSVCEEDVLRINSYVRASFNTLYENGQNVFDFSVDFYEFSF